MSGRNSSIRTQLKNIGGTRVEGAALGMELSQPQCVSPLGPCPNH
jgi:hypothetical protein